MKNNLLFVLFLFFSSATQAQNFGFFANAVRLSLNNQVYNYDTYDTTDASRFANLAFSDDVPYTFYLNFTGSLGTFVQNSGSLLIDGGIIKTFKNNNSNVCGTTLFYTVYPEGSRPAAPVYTPINFNFLDNCLAPTFPYDGSPCSNGDQQWADTATVGGTDLTTNAPGDYTIEVYYQIPGAYNSTSDCSDTVYDNNNNAPANYTANFTITNTVVPLTLLNFSGSYQQPGVVLNWSVANELNNKGFEIERSTDGQNFTSLSFVNSKGNNTGTIAYSYIDNSSIEGKVFYRLKTIANNGTFKYSSIIPVAINAAAFAKFTVQLTSQTLTLYTRSALGNNSAVKITDLLGRTLFTKNLNAQPATTSIIIPLNHPLTGVYIISLYDGASGTMNSQKIKA